MPVPLLDLRAQHATIRDEIVPKMMEIVESQLFILGAPVERLEQQVAELSHTKYAIGCASGTDALLLALRALDIGRGDEVITTPFTFFATAGTIHNAGATAVFVDIDPRTYNILPDAAGAARNSKTKAVVPVDLFGQIAPIEQVMTASTAASTRSRLRSSVPSCRISPRGAPSGARMPRTTTRPSPSCTTS
jgi:dTDP-4-amino-4,6-dideoxygalactose transaminase